MESNTQTQSKWSSLQMQVAMLSLTMASIQTQLKQLESEFAQFKADSKPTFQQLNNATSALSVDDGDDSSSEGYDTDESEKVKPKLPKVKTKGVDRYIMISNYIENCDKGDEGNDSGYDSEDSIPRSIPTFVPKDTSLNPFNNDIITEDWKARALLLEEL